MKNLSLVFLSLFTFISLHSCGQHKSKVVYKKVQKDLTGYSRATFASGCFWCVEAVFESVKGVEEAVSGYAGGKEPNPTYEKVGTNNTGHAEAVQVYYDSAVVSYATLLKVYFASQDPTQVKGQGPDRGASYRSIIFYSTEDKKKEAENYIAVIQKSHKKPIAAELMPFEKFWTGEDYHQDYVPRNPNVGYVRSESIPRIRRFQKQYPELIKDDHKY